MNQPIQDLIDKNGGQLSFTVPATINGYLVDSEVDSFNKILSRWP